MQVVNFILNKQTCRVTFVCTVVFIVGLVGDVEER